MAKPGSVPLEQQKDIIKELWESPLVHGATWYVVDAKWFSKWKSYVGYEDWNKNSIGEDTPGPIDNSNIVTDVGSTILKLHLLESSDYILLPEEAWKKLVEWYTLADGQVPLSRSVIKKGIAEQLRVEVYPVEVKLYYGRDMARFIVKYFSCMNTLGDVVAETRQSFSIPNDKELLLLIQYLPSQLETLTKLESTLEDAGISYGQVLVVEDKPVNGPWPRQGSSTDVSSAGSGTKNSFYGNSSASGTNLGPDSMSYSYESSYSNSSSQRDNAGLCGLSNLGNTCFMNSALQCMSNVPPLTEYMLSDRWKEELNTRNPLGMRGEIATTYAALIQTMWSGKHTCAVPRNFKVAVGRFKPEFSGYQQQDSQELMAFLLDGLHEDLNRIRNKPYVEVKETDDRPEEEVAIQTWHDYRLRNDSIIVDIFHGLLKSTLVCPKCTKVSIKFDPFCYLSLPLPVKKERQMMIYFVSGQPKKRIRQCKVTVSKMGSVLDLCVAVSNLFKVAHDKLVVVDIYNHRFHKIFSVHESISHITERDDIYVFEVPVNSFDDPNTIIIPVYMREVFEKRNFYSSGYTQLFGVPILVPVSRKLCSYNILYKCIHAHLVRYIRTVTDDDDNVSSSSFSDRSSEISPRDSCDVGATDETDSEMPKREEGEGVDSGDGLGAVGIAAPSARSSAALAESSRLFTIRAINSYGSTDGEQIADDGTALDLRGHLYLAADWSSKNKAKYYDENEAKLFEIDQSMENVPLSKKQTIQLTDCLDLFATMEKLGEHDTWYCPVCKEHQQATKKFDIWELPQILVIHLKRFSYSRYWRDKLDTFIDYPVRGLDMSRFVIKPGHRAAVYDLIAVSNHYGGLGGGHYTAFAKNCCRDHWYHFDDSSVSAVSEDSVVTKAGYVLVYQRRMLGDAPDSGIVADSNSSTNGSSSPTATAMDM